MLRALGRRLTYANVIATSALFLALLLAPSAGSATAAAAAEPGPTPPAETEYGSPPQVTILGVERDARFGRAWLLAELSGEGHLRTVSGRLKAFAPPGEYEGGFVRIPLIPKLPFAKRLRRKGHATATLTIYFDPPREVGGSVVLNRRVTPGPKSPEEADARRSLTFRKWTPSSLGTSPTRPVLGPTPHAPRWRGCGGASATSSTGAW